jgi:hypothetical protein
MKPIPSCRPMNRAQTAASSEEFSPAWHCSHYFICGGQSWEPTLVEAFSSLVSLLLETQDCRLANAISAEYISNHRPVVSRISPNLWSRPARWQRQMLLDFWIASSSRWSWRICITIGPRQADQDLLILSKWTRGRHIANCIGDIFVVIGSQSIPTRWIFGADPLRRSRQSMAGSKCKQERYIK